MNKLTHLGLILVAIYFFSCNTNEKNKEKETFTLENSIERALLNGYYTQINENIGVLIYQDIIYSFSRKPKGFSNDKFLLHLVKADNSFDNLDFFKENYTVNDSLTGIFTPLEIVKRKIINIEQYKSIRIGQFKRNQDGSVKHVWVKQTSVKDIFSIKEQYLNQFKPILKKNILNESFKKDLSFGAFFKTKSAFYILLSDDKVFFIAKNEDKINEKIMLHFIRKDNSFNNKSFKFKTNLYNIFLEKPYKDFQVAMVRIPIEEENFNKIRIGQYNERGNIWSQEIVLDEIFSNELLKYRDELEN